MHFTFLYDIFIKNFGVNNMSRIAFHLNRLLPIVTFMPGGWENAVTSGQPMFIVEMQDVVALFAED